MGELQLEVRSLLDVALGGEEVRKLCQEARLNERQSNEWELLFAEATTASLMTHHAKDVSVHFRIGAEQAELTLRDDGEPIQREELEQVPRILGKSSASGVQLLKLLTDELTYDAGPPNTLTLRRSRG